MCLRGRGWTFRSAAGDDAVLDDPHRHNRYLYHLTIPLHRSNRKLPAAVRADVKRMVNQLSRSLSVPDEGLLPLLAILLRSFRPVCLSPWRRNSSCATPAKLRPKLRHILHAWPRGLPIGRCQCKKNFSPFGKMIQKRELLPALTLYFFGVWGGGIRFCHSLMRLAISGSSGTVALIRISSPLQLMSEYLPESSLWKISFVRPRSMPK